jgi:hypothetical protein
MKKIMVSFNATLELQMGCFNLMCNINVGSMLDLCPLVKNLVGIYGSKKVGFMVFIVLQFSTICAK